jgi:hypothetical protein
MDQEQKSAARSSLLISRKGGVQVEARETLGTDEDRKLHAPAIRRSLPELNRPAARRLALAGA